MTGPDEHRLTGDPVQDINIIGRELGIAPPPPMRVQPRSRRTARDRQQIADAVAFINGGVASRPRLTERQLAELHKRYANTAGLVERHEAGHYVVATALGVECDWVEAARAGHKGSTALARELEDPKQVLPILVAGLVAERGHLSWSVEFAAMWEYTDDADTLAEWLDACGDTGAERAELRRWAEDTAGEILWHERRHFERVAAALERHHRLDAAALAELRGRAD